MKKIIYTNLDGSLSVIHPASQESVAQVIPEVAAMTEDEYLAFIKNKDIPVDATNVHIVDELVIPQDRSFRNAWVHDDASPGNVRHDQNKCVEITKDRLRVEREPILAELDARYLKALESNSDTSAIVTEKQRLRDITTIPHVGMSLDEMKSVKAELTI